MGCNTNECRFLSSLVHRGEPPGCCALPRRIRPVLQGVLQDGGLHHHSTRGHTRRGPGGLPQDNHIAVLRRKVFSHLEQCSKLYLDHNSMTIIESRAFKDLDNLDYLYLNNNELQGIRSDMWRGLKMVRTLSLASNRISILQTGAFIVYRSWRRCISAEMS